MGVDLGPHFLVRHAIFGVSGEVFKTFSFATAFDLVANPAVDGARADGRKRRVALTDAWGAVDAGRGLWLRAGVFAAPFSLENTTNVADLSLLERSTATRFVVPGNRLLGVSLCGSTLHNAFGWDAGAFGLETLTPGEFERIFDGVGRVTWRPAAAPGRGPEDELELGLSGRVGTRNRRDSVSDLPALTTSQGFALWRPTWVTADGTPVRIVGARTQGAIGGEFRLPGRGYAITGEFDYLTRGADEVAQAAPDVSLRRGRMQGTTSYLELSLWPLQLLGLVDGYPPVWGRYPTKDHLEVASTTVLPERYGFEVSLLASHVLMHYAAASREGSPDPAAPPGHIAVMQFSAGVNYWQTERFKLGMNFNFYRTPHDAGHPQGAVVPGNFGPPGDDDHRADSVYELAFRLAAKF